MAAAKKIRVLAVNHTGLLGGAERSLLELLDRDQRAGETTAALACPAGELADSASGLGVTVFPISSLEFGFKTSWAALPALVLGVCRASLSVRRATRSFAPDVIHANSPRATLISIFAGRLARVPILTHLRDVLPDSRRGTLVRKLVRAVSGRIVANSQFTADDFRQGSGAAVDVVYNLLGNEFTEPDPTLAAAFRSEFELGDAPLVGMVGQLTPWKDQALAIRAFAQVAESAPDAVLVLVGSAKFATVGGRFENDAYEQELRRTVADLGLEGRVVFAGQRAHVSGPLQSFAITLMPSHAEPFGRAAIEAMACGSAVIATTVGGPVEFIEDGDTGLLRRPGSEAEWAAAIKLLLSDTALRERLATNGRSEVVRRFAEDSTETQVVPLYRELAKS